MRGVRRIAPLLFGMGGSADCCVPAIRSRRPFVGILGGRPSAGTKATPAVRTAVYRVFGRSSFALGGAFPFLRAPRRLQNCRIPSETPRWRPRPVVCVGLRLFLPRKRPENPLAETGLPPTLDRRLQETRGRDMLTARSSESPGDPASSTGLSAPSRRAKIARESLRLNSP